MGNPGEDGGKVGLKGRRHLRLRVITGTETRRRIVATLKEADCPRGLRPWSLVLAFRFPSYY
jgi:hypothetical protein